MSVWPHSQRILTPWPHLLQISSSLTLFLPLLIWFQGPSLTLCLPVTQSHLLSLSHMPLFLTPLPPQLQTLLPQLYPPLGPDLDLDDLQKLLVVVLLPLPLLLLQIVPPLQMVVSSFKKLLTEAGKLFEPMNLFLSLT